MMPRPRKPNRPTVLSMYGVSARMSAAGFTCHRDGVAGYSLEHGRTPDVLEVWHLDPIGNVVDAGPEMRTWGLHLKRAGFTVHVAENTHLLVTLPDGAAAGATHAVERAA